MVTRLNNNDSNPTTTTYGVPISDINKPPTATPKVVPMLQDDKNNPLAKSGASGAEDIIKY